MAIGFIAIVLAFNIEDDSEIMAARFLLGLGLLFFSFVSLCSLAIRKFDIALAFSTLGALYCLFLMYIELIPLQYGYPVFWLFFILFFECLLFFTISSIISYKYYNTVFLVEKALKNSYPVPVPGWPGHYSYAPQPKIHTKLGIASIILGFLSFEFIGWLVPVAISMGVIAVFMGVKALRKGDTYGRGGIVLGAISTACGSLFWAYILINL